MLGRTHQIIGLTASAGWYFSSAGSTYNSATLFGVVISSVAGALIPDLDRATADIWKKVPFGKIFGRVVDPFIDHRSFSHSLFGLTFFGVIIYLILNVFPASWGMDIGNVFWAFMIGYSTHLIADIITDKGIPLFFALPNFVGIPPKPFHGARIMTGKWFENLVIFPIFNLLFIIIIISNFSKIKGIFE